LNMLMRTKLLITIAFSLCFPASVFGESEFGAWERVEPSDVRYSEDWVLRKKQLDFNLSAKGDFDGDSIPDEVYFAKNISSGKYAVFIKMGVSKGKPILFDSDNLKDLPRMGISLVRPGAYSSKCDEKDSRLQGCKARVVLKNDGFSIFMYESAARVAYFENMKWQSFWIGD